jgi:hypothetical protein
VVTRDNKMTSGFNVVLWTGTGDFDKLHSATQTIDLILAPDYSSKGIPPQKEKEDAEAPVGTSGLESGVKEVVDALAGNGHQYPCLSSSTFTVTSVLDTKTTTDGGFTYSFWKIFKFGDTETGSSDIQNTLKITFLLSSEPINPSDLSSAQGERNSNTGLHSGHPVVTEHQNPSH